MQNSKYQQVWDDSIELAADIHKLVAKFPEDHQQNFLCQELLDTTNAMCINITHGLNADAEEEVNKHIDIANGKSCRLQSTIELCVDLDLGISRELAETLIQRISDIRDRLPGPKPTFGFPMEFVISSN